MALTIRRYVEVQLYSSGLGPYTKGLSVLGVTSGAGGTIVAVGRRPNRVMLSDVSGTFQLNETLSDGSATQSIAGLTSFSMREENQGITRHRISHQRWFTCRICGLDYPRDKVILRGGGAWCIPNKDYYELPEYRRNRRRRH